MSRVALPCLLALGVLVALLPGCSTPSGNGASTSSSPTMSMTDEMPMGMLHVAVKDDGFDPPGADASKADGIHFTNEGTKAHGLAVVDGSGTVVLDITLQPGDSTHFAPPATGRYHAYLKEDPQKGADFDVR